LQRTTVGNPALDLIQTPLATQLMEGLELFKRLSKKRLPVWNLIFRHEYHSPGAPIKLANHLPVTLWWLPPSSWRILASRKKVFSVQKKPLIETNPHLTITARYQKALVANVASSTAIETGTSIESIARLLTAPRTKQTIKKTGHSPQ
jgi:hypothetical protein